MCAIGWAARISASFEGGLTDEIATAPSAGVGGLVLVVALFALGIALLVQRAHRHRAEDAARKSEARYRSLVDMQSELICRFLPDTTLTFVNDACCRFWNRTRTELLGRKFIELVPRSAQAAVLDRIKRLKHGIDSLQNSIVLADGSTGSHHWINHAIVDRRGKVVEVQGIGRDITDRKRAEESIVQLATRNSAMLRAIPDLMFVLLRDGTFVDYHAREPRRLFMAPEEFLGRTVGDVLPAALADTWMDAIERACRGDDPVVVEYDLPIGRRLRHFEARLVSAEEGRVLSIVRDVTDSKHAQARNRDLAGRLITSQEAERTRIARDLHDDVCQEVAAVSVELSHLRQRGGDIASREVQERLRAVQKRTESVAESLRLLSHGLHPSVLKHLGLVAALQAHCGEVERHQHILITFFVDGEVEPVSDLIALSLFRIAQEALRNSTRHGHARHASVSLSRVGGSLTLAIADDGRGFDVDAVRGAGVELVSIEERARLVQGQAIVTSRPGQGTLINVRVPVAGADDASDAWLDQLEGQMCAPPHRPVEYDRP